MQCIQQNTHKIKWQEIDAKWGKLVLLFIMMILLSSKIIDLHLKSSTRPDVILFLSIIHQVSNFVYGNKV